jgi:hypothetical protein
VRLILWMWAMFWQLLDTAVHAPGVWWVFPEWLQVWVCDRFDGALKAYEPDIWADR